MPLSVLTTLGSKMWLTVVYSLPRPVRVLLPCPHTQNATSLSCEEQVQHTVTHSIRLYIYRKFSMQRASVNTHHLYSMVQAFTQQRRREKIWSNMKTEEVTQWPHLRNFHAYEIVIKWSKQKRYGRSQWPRCLKHEMSSPAQTLGSWVRILLDEWMSSLILCLCCPV
jgi:hypothetical protein